MMVRVHRVTTERWSEQDEAGRTRTFSHTAHTLEQEERPHRATVFPAKLQRAKARYAPQSLRAPAGDTLVWVQDESGTVCRLASLNAAQRTVAVAREAGLKAGLRKHSRVKVYDPTSLEIRIGGVLLRGAFDWPSAGNPGRP